MGKITIEILGSGRPEYQDVHESLRKMSEEPRYRRRIGEIIYKPYGGVDFEPVVLARDDGQTLDTIEGHVPRRAEIRRFLNYVCRQR